MRSPGVVLLLLLAAVSARREQGPHRRNAHPVQRRQASDFRPLAGFPPQQHGHGYGGGPLYPPPVYPHPYPGSGHQGPPYAPHATVHIEPEKVVLNCIVQGYVSTSIQWLKPDGPGLIAEGGAVLWDRRHLLVETAVFGGGRRSRLVLSYPRPRHLGRYICRAGGASSRSFTVGGGAAGGFQPVYHGRSGGSGRIQAHQPGAGPESGAEPEQGAERSAEAGRESEPLTEGQRQEILQKIEEEIQEVEDAVEKSKGH